MMLHTELFAHGFRFDCQTDVGKERMTNQDRVIACPEQGFFAVSDGMGGLASGGEAADMIANVLPGLIREAHKELKRDTTAQHAAQLLDEQVRIVSDSMYDTLNNGGRPKFGATLCGVWLVGSSAVFINIGDSRGYALGFYKKRIRQITVDHNVAAILVDNGELTPAEAKEHPSSCVLTRFVGMKAPALPDTFVEAIAPGDRLLLCSDGLYGMVEEENLPRMLRSSRNMPRVGRRLVRAANAAGGRDNIAVVSLRIFAKQEGYP